MTKLNFGGVAQEGNGKLTLGKLECSGKTTLTSMPTSCSDLFIAGNQINGLSTVKSSSKQLLTMYCDFSKANTAVAQYFHLEDDNSLNY